MARLGRTPPFVPVIRPGLDHVRRALSRLGHPEDRFAAVLVAGTNGKGSVCALVESVLRRAGHRTGLYTSPHLVRREERIRIEGTPVSSALWNRLSRRVAAVREPLTEFEAQTLMAFLAFAEAGVDIAVVEVGLGGRWDATNALPAPEATAITTIGHDHREWLGPTLRHIYREKRGIARSGTPLIQNIPAFLRPESRRWARDAGVPVETLGDDFQVRPGTGARPRVVAVVHGTGERRTYPLPFAGAHQRDNAAVAAELLSVLSQRGWRITPTAAQRGFAAARWAGRFDVIRRRPPVVVDGAHNREAVEALVRAWSDSPWGRDRPTILFGCLNDKEARVMIRSLRGLSNRAVMVTLPSPRTRSAESLAALWGRSGSVITAGNFADALKHAGPGPLLITGSLYLAGEALRHWGIRP